MRKGRMATRRNLPEPAPIQLSESRLHLFFSRQRPCTCLLFNRPHLPAFRSNVPVFLGVYVLWNTGRERTTAKVWAGVGGGTWAS